MAVDNESLKKTVPRLAANTPGEDKKEDDSPLEALRRARKLAEERYAAASLDAMTDGRQAPAAESGFQLKGSLDVGSIVTESIKSATQMQKEVQELKEVALRGKDEGAQRFYEHLERELAEVKQAAQRDPLDVYEDIRKRMETIKEELGLHTGSADPQIGVQLAKDRQQHELELEKLRQQHDKDMLELRQQIKKGDREFQIELARLSEDKRRWGVEWEDKKRVKGSALDELQRVGRALVKSLAEEETEAEETGISEKAKGLKAEAPAKITITCPDCDERFEIERGQTQATCPSCSSEHTITYRRQAETKKQAEEAEVEELEEETE